MKQLFSLIINAYFCKTEFYNKIYSVYESSQLNHKKTLQISFTNN